MASNCDHHYVLIVYGHMTADLLDQAKDEKIVLGGPVRRSDSPLKWCTKCLTTYPESQPEGYFLDE
jgi:hypothetical protein